MKTNKLQISRLTPIKSLKEFIEDIKNKTTNYLLEAFLRYSNLAKKTKKLLLV